MLRILFNSRSSEYKEPFGTLTPTTPCTLRVKIPIYCKTLSMSCRILEENGTPFMDVPMSLLETEPPYETWVCRFTVEQPGLYFYFFHIVTEGSTFSLLKQGEDTNMEAGDWWQLSCTTQEASVPQWAQGAVMYQVFPDRFCKSRDCDLTGKLEPYTVHENWNEEVSWQPTPEGLVLNNDFYGGNFRGIEEKIPYLSSLGVSILYLNPISKSFSSHRYDTGDYKTPDPMLGTEEEFSQLCETAHKAGIRVVLDGVYSHTGSNSLYFDKEGAFGGHGAYHDPNSPYRSWYRFRKWPDSYESWWNFDTLPCLDKNCPELMDYIIDGEDSVVAHWLNLGADGFRLDVVDELPDHFILRLKKRIREIKPDALLIGEVWEDASNKVAYGVRRRYFVDGELDGVMNYPFRKAIIDFVRQKDDGRAFKETVMTIAENYPAEVLASSMTLLGTHDTPRILTALMDDFEGSRQDCASRHLSLGQLLVARERLMAASFLQFTLPGTPCIYYGDEAGMEGYKDPFNRRTFPWGHEDTLLQAHYTRLGALRKKHPALSRGSISFLSCTQSHLAFQRSCPEGEKLSIYVNLHNDPWEIPSGKLLLGHNMATVAEDAFSLMPYGMCIMEA